MRLLFGLFTSILFSLVSINQINTEVVYNYYSIDSYEESSKDFVTTVLTTFNYKYEDGYIEELEVKFYYDWNKIPNWRLNDILAVFYDSHIFELKEDSFEYRNFYYRNREFISNNGYDCLYNSEHVSWSFMLKEDYTLKIGGEITKMYGYGKFTLLVKEKAKKLDSNIYGMYIHSRFVDANVKLNKEGHLTVKGNKGEYAVKKKIKI